MRIAQNSLKQFVQNGQNIKNGNIYKKKRNIRLAYNLKKDILIDTTIQRHYNAQNL